MMDDVTVGSALDTFGGNLPYKDFVALASQTKNIPQKLLVFI